MIDKNALLALADEMCRRMTGGNGNPAPDPVYGAELLEWAERIRALAAQAPAADSEAVDEAMVKRAEQARVETLHKVTAYGSAGVEERYLMAMRAALTAALAKQAAQESD